MNKSEIKSRLAERDGLRCAVSGEAVESVDELDIEHVRPFAMGGGAELDNLILVKRSVSGEKSSYVARKADELVRELKQRQEELAKNEREAFEREQAYRAQIEAQKHELEAFRRTLQRDQAERDAALAREIDEHRKRVLQQESALSQRLDETETQFRERLAALEHERARLHAGIRQKDEELQLARDELDKEKLRYAEESVERVQKNASTYVTQAISSLNTAAKGYQSASKLWAIGGVSSLAGGVAVATYFGMVGIVEQSVGRPLDWANLVFFTVKGLVVVALFIALAKYCFVYSQSFMHEALKNTERMHAIHFGQFYLESYGANADWSQIKEAFEHWNISPSSSFDRGDADRFDPKMLERISQLVDSVGKENRGK